jgi:hypothetical protein
VNTPTDNFESVNFESVNFESVNFESVSPESRFHTHQVLCLTCAPATLYVEVVDIVEARQLCWVHPLALAWPLEEAQEAQEAQEVQAQEPLDAVILENELAQKIAWHDLRQDSDLLWPLTLFRPAYDTEVLPLLDFLHHKSPLGHRLEDTRNQPFRQFIRLVWQRYPQAFGPSNSGKSQG